MTAAVPAAQQGGTLSLCNSISNHHLVSPSVPPVHPVRARWTTERFFISTQVSSYSTSRHQRLPRKHNNFSFIQSYTTWSPRNTKHF